MLFVYDKCKSKSLLPHTHKMSIAYCKKNARKIEKSSLGREDFSCFWSCIYKPNSVIQPKSDESNLSRSGITVRLKRFSKPFSKKELGTILHRGKDLAVSPELNRFVTVRTYALLHVGITHYPSHSAKSGTRCVRTFLPQTKIQE